MLAILKRWLRKLRPATRPSPPVLLPPPQGRAPRVLSPAKPLPLLLAKPFDPSAPVPPVVTEYDAVQTRMYGLWDGKGLDGAIAFTKALTVDDNKLPLYHAYLRMLRELAEPSPLRRIDFHALPPGARPYLLGPYLGTLVGQVYPRLCWDSSDPAKGQLTYVFPGGPADANTWRPRLPEISAWLGGTWTMGEATANTLTLVRRTPLPDRLPLKPAYLKPGALFVGLDADTQQPVSIPFAEMTSGTFIAGASGTGKSNALHVLVRGLFANLNLFSAVYLIDGKDGVAFNRYRTTAPGKVRVLWQDAEVWRVAGDLVQLMRQRNDAQREQNIDNASADFVAVVIDEMATFTAKPSVDNKHPDNKLHTRFVDDLTQLTRRGRSTGLRLFLSAQEPVVKQIPASIRANCLTTLAFRRPVDAHATALFGQLDGLPADPRRLPRGRALFKNGLSGEVRQVQVPVVAPPR